MSDVQGYIFHEDKSLYALEAGDPIPRVGEQIHFGDHRGGPEGSHNMPSATFEVVSVGYGVNHNITTRKVRMYQVEINVKLVKADPKWEAWAKENL